MAQYGIKLWNDLETKLIEFREVKSRPYAFHVARQFAYNSLEAFGKLDTHAAYNVMELIDAANDILAVGENKHFTISNTGRSITVSRYL